MRDGTGLTREQHRQAWQLLIEVLKQPIDGRQKILDEARREDTEIAGEVGEWLKHLPNIVRDEAPPGPGTLVPIVYDDLCAIASGLLRRVAPSLRYDPEEVVSEAFARIARQRKPIENRPHLVATGVREMHRALIDILRRSHTKPERLRTDFEPGDPEQTRDHSEVLAAIEEFSDLDDRGATVVYLKVIAGMPGHRIAEFLGVGRRTVDMDWATAKAWLTGRLGGDPLAAGKSHCAHPGVVSRSLADARTSSLPKFVSRADKEASKCGQ